ncbi:MAG: hypothetical protein B7Z55_05670 [Planctomycetales bacterium 12-60-4]|nr:MAG: hypothetical protein B7Z55_05670 [Planctomycetales bacterium 12-60-4]
MEHSRAVPTISELFDLRGRAALITGATGHLGRALAEALAEAGARVVVSSRELDKARAVAGELGGDAAGAHQAVVLDHLDEASIASGFAEAVSLAGKIDILINNGHAPLGADWSTVTGDQFQQQMANATGYFLLARHLRDHSVERKHPASIVLLGSMYGVVGSYPDAYANICAASPVAYHVLKGGVVQLTRHLAVYWAKDGVRVNCLSPGPFPGPKAPPEMVSRLTTKSPMGRMGQPRRHQSPHFMPESKALQSRTQDLYREARHLIPGGTQLLSKRPEMFAPGQWPAYYSSARGCEVTDLDGRRYLDFTHNGVGACLLGYAHPRVTAAVIERVQAGAMCTLNSPDEVRLARELIDLHPWAEQARFARGGGESLAIAARLARAATGRDVIAFCGYHGWSDWYLAANLNADRALDGHLLPGLNPAGVPRGLNSTAIPFTYNRLEELEAIVRTSGSRLAAVIMEPTRNTPPATGFLQGIRQLCDEAGAKLIFDEVTTGFRLRLGGAHLDYGIEPDVAVVAKALGNGHPIGAVIGKATTMEAAQDSFISSTYWTEGVGPAAALAMIAVCRETDVPGHVRMIGDTFRDVCRRLADLYGIPLSIGGYPALTTLNFQHAESAALVTLYTVRMLDRGFLAGSGFYPTLAHQPEHLARFAEAADVVFAELADALRCGDVAARIGGPVKHGGFARLT